MLLDIDRCLLERHTLEVTRVSFELQIKLLLYLPVYYYCSCIVSFHPFAAFFVPRAQTGLQKRKNVNLREQYC